MPVYNSRATLDELVARLTDVLSEVTPHFEVVLVNDGSRDDSWSVIRELAARHTGVRGIDLMRNYGQHNALLSGVRAAECDIVVTIDDDLQHPPEEIPKLLARLEDGYDVVYGTPEREQHGLWRDLASQLTKLALQSAMSVEVARNVSPFRAFRTTVRNAFADYRSPLINLDVLLTWATTRFASVTVRHETRRAGRSNYTFRKLLAHALNMVTGFSVVPLQLVSVIGFGCTLLGIAALIYVLTRFFVEGGVVPGFPFLASMVAIFSGAQLLALGIIGEYLARVHLRMMDKPPYAVRECVPERRP